MLADGFFSRLGLEQTFRWLHILSGIVWIGMLYFFNLVQVPAYAAFGDEAKARNIAIDKVTRRALWWFRWGAVSTVVMGISITVAAKDFFKANALGVSFSKTGNGLAISLGMLLAIIMFLNVWGVIWRLQKVVLANAANVLAGGEPNPEAPAAARRAVMASRQNVVFSIGMLYLMVVASHDVYLGGADSAISSGKVAAFWLIAIVVTAVLELNALGFMPWKAEPKKGLNTMYDSVQNVLIAAGAFWVIVLIVCELFLKQ
ncbi:MAG TPA: hypothetical protein VHN36_04925 [Ilumatobacteraceae bacterium]|nr:hypothetical protein [Ilumatobacteraceae bacterium]